MIKAMGLVKDCFQELDEQNIEQNIFLETLFMALGYSDSVCIFSTPPYVNALCHWKNDVSMH